MNGRTQNRRIDRSNPSCHPAVLPSCNQSVVGLKTYGTMAVDWEERINFERLRTERLARARNISRSRDGRVAC